MQLQKILLVLSLVFLSDCASGPKVNNYISDPANGNLRCANRKGSCGVLAYADSANFVGYSPVDAQKLLDYCAARKLPETQAPEFSQCISNPSKGGFDCASEQCAVLPQGSGMSCIPTVKFFVSYVNSENYIAFSPYGSTTLLDYCSVSIKAVQ